MVVLGCETRIGLLLVVRVSMGVAKGSSSTLGDRHAGRWAPVPRPIRGWARPSAWHQQMPGRGRSSTFFRA